jgi:hypothetical protein
MKCRLCGAKLQRDWLYCPHCGTRKSSGLNRNFEKVLQVLENSFKDFRSKDGKEDKSLPSAPRFRGVKKELLEDDVVLEPHVLTKENGKVMQIHLPLIKTQKDISIKKFQSSVEVKAKAGDRIYFAVIPLKYRNLVRQDFSNGLLTLRFT